MAELNGKDFVALVRLSDGDDNTLVEVGQTCENIHAAPRPEGLTTSQSLAYLLASHLIAPVPVAPLADPAAAAAPAPKPAAKTPTTKGSET